MSSRYSSRPSTVSMPADSAPTLELATRTTSSSTRRPSLEKPSPSSGSSPSSGTTKGTWVAPTLVQTIELPLPGSSR